MVYLVSVQHQSNIAKSQITLKYKKFCIDICDVAAMFYIVNSSEYTPWWTIMLKNRIVVHFKLA